MVGIVCINSLYVLIPYVKLFGHMVSPTDCLVGSTYVLRDFAQREIKQYVLVAMIIAGLLSYQFASHAVATASIAAFAVGETIDWLIFTYTRKPFSQRLLWSAMVSSPFDSWVFLVVYGHFSWLELGMFTFFKFTGVLVLYYIWYWQQKRRGNAEIYATAG